jgi:uncharacterized OsmC-like protein
VRVAKKKWLCGFSLIRSHWVKLIPLTGTPFPHDGRKISWLPRNSTRPRTSSLCSLGSNERQRPGRGSSINEGELLFAAIATCFCNDIYREAAKRSIDVQDVKVEVTGTFGNPGEPARDVTYRVQVRANASQAIIDDLIRATDSVTEIQNTLRAGCAVG